MDHDKKKRQFHFMVKVTRNYGNHSIEFGLQEAVSISSGHERREHFDNLHAQLADQIQYYEKVYLPTVKIPETQVNERMINGEDTFVVSEVRVEFKKNKKLVNLAGGRWTKFGVPVYEDSSAWDLVKDYDFGTHKIEHGKLVATAHVVNESPKRIIACESHL